MRIDLYANRLVCESACMRNDQLPDEIPGFFRLRKSHIFTARSEDTIFIFHVWGYCDKWHFAISDYFGCFEKEPGRFDTKSFRYKSFRYNSKSIRYTCKVDSIQTHVTWSCFDTKYYTTYKWLNEPSKTYSLDPERTQTSFVNETNPCLREPSRESNACTSLLRNENTQTIPSFG